MISKPQLSFFILLASLSACTTPTPLAPPATAEPSQTSIPTDTFTPIPSESPPLVPSPTLLPTLTSKPTITPTPTLGPPVTRTPASPAHCPMPTGQTYTMTPINPVQEDYESQILEFLNTVGSPTGLQEALNGLSPTAGSTTWNTKVQISTVDVTGDRTQDVVVDLIFYAEGQDDFLIVNLYIFSCHKGQYEIKYKNSTYGAKFPGSEPDPGAGVRAIRDMNLDGVPEIVFSFLYISHGIVTIWPDLNYARFFFIVEWDGEEFVDLLQYAGGSMAWVSNGDGSLRDTNGDGTLELILTNGASREPGMASILYRPHTEILAWDGRAFSVSCIESSPPEYRYHAVEDGDNATRCGDYEKALASYQRAIFDEQLLDWKEILFYDPPIFIETAPDPDPNERQRLSAYSRYRIMLLHVVENRLDSAKEVYDTLQEMFTEGSVGHAYAELSTAFWQEFSINSDIAASCSKAIEFASKNQEEILAAFSSEYYRYTTHIKEPEDLCPFR